MENEYPHLFEKYLNGTATRQEAERVLQWVRTDEGKEYIKKHFGREIRHIGVFASRPENPHHLWDKIETGLKKEAAATKVVRSNRKTGFYSYWLVAALILIVTGTLTFSYLQWNMTDEPGHYEVIKHRYSTGEGELKLLTLSDGSVIHLNEHSSIEIPGEYPGGSRTVLLEGEAFFEVEAGYTHPFVVRSGKAKVTVLGTKFSVNNNERTREMIVAVSEGKVRFGQQTQGGSGQYILEKDMVGVLNRDTFDMEIRQTDISNYLSWMSGRLSFDGIRFSEVITQLGRIFDIEHRVGDRELLNRRLTADLTERSVRDVLETIARALQVEVEFIDNVAYWKSESARDSE